MIKTTVIQCKATVNSKEYDSYKTAIPKSFVKLMKLIKGSKLRWTKHKKGVLLTKLEPMDKEVLEE